MRVEDILNSDTYISAAALGTALNGVYLTEVYKGRAVRLEKTDAAHIVRLNNPKAEFLNKNANDCHFPEMKSGFCEFPGGFGLPEFA